VELGNHAQGMPDCSTANAGAGAVKEHLTFSPQSEARSSRSRLKILDFTFAEYPRHASQSPTLGCRIEPQFGKADKRNSVMANP